MKEKNGIEKNGMAESGMAEGELEENSLSQTGPFTEPEPLPFPIVSIALLTIITVLFYAMLHSGQGDVTRVASLFGDKENNLIRAGQWWRLITPIFLHGSWGHLIANGLTLMMLGIPMERIYGPRKFFLIYMLAGIAGNLCSFWFSATPSLGASGALYGLMGAGLVFPLRYKNLIDPQARKSILSQLGRAAAINISINFFPGLHLDTWAHMGGMAGGCLAALVWIPDVLEDGPETRAYSGALWSGIAGMLLLLGVACSQQWNIAHRMASETMPYYAVDPADPWLGISLPAGWRPADTVGPNGVHWRGPREATIQIIDSREDPHLIEATKAYFKSRKSALKPLVVDGKRGEYALIKNGNTTVEFYQVVAEDRLIAMRFSCPAIFYQEMKPTFDRILNSIRFVRPPHNQARN